MGINLKFLFLKIDFFFFKSNYFLSKFDFLKKIPRAFQLVINPPEGTGVEGEEEGTIFELVINPTKGTGVEGEEEGTIFELGGRIDPSRDIYAIPSQVTHSDYIIY